MNPDLVIVRAGDGSLHPSWLAADGDARRWDLHISYFGKRQEPFGTLPPGVTLSRDAGSKYHGLDACLRANPQFVDSYRRIALPDDDLQASRGGWNETFAVLEEAGAMLGQPSLDQLSFFSHPVTLQRPAYRWREVNLVEVMTPTFTADLLREAIPLFRENETSWGIDFLFAELVRRRGGTMAIVDAACFLHTRRVGKGTQYKPGGISPRVDKVETLKRHGIVEYPGRAIRGIRRVGGTDAGGKADRGIARARLNRRLVNFLGINTLMR